MTLSVAIKNTKAPSLSRTGKHRWTVRRGPLVKHLLTPRPTVLGLIESGSGKDLTWWKKTLKKHDLTWAKGGAYWQNCFLGPEATFVFGKQRHQPKSNRLKNDDKPVNITGYRYKGDLYVLVIVHPENEGGNTRAADKLRYNQIKFGLKVGREEAKKHGGKYANVMVGTDSNAPSGRVLTWLHRYTTYRDAFSLADFTSGEQYVSNNKWGLTRIHGERIDILLVHKSWKGRIRRALNRLAHADADHNEQYVEFDV